MFGGPAPDALAALIHLLATLRDGAGNTTVTGLDNTRTWDGVAWPPGRFRTDAGLLDGVSLLGDGTVSDMVWARPAVTVLGIDCPPVVGSAAAVQPHASARLNLRVPPGMDPVQAQDALVEHLQAAVPWGARVAVEREASGAPFRAHTGGPAYAALAAAMQEAYGRQMSTLGQGGSIPLCNVLADTYPDAGIILMGVEEPLTSCTPRTKASTPTRSPTWPWPRRCSCAATPPPGSPGSLGQYPASRSSRPWAANAQITNTSTAMISIDQNG
jgi:cysteinylglycine-S-conjugate dipeptidase